MLALKNSRASARRFFCALAFCASTLAASTAAVAQQPLARDQIVFKVGSAPERMEMIVNTSRILTMDSKIPQAQVNNPEVLEVTPLSPTQIQIFAKKAGVTQVNLWDEKEQIHTIDVMVFGDARELAMLLETQFPESSLKVVPTANSVVISGFVDNPDDVTRIIQMSEDYYPKVINNIRVGGVEQVLLHVKVMEVSRTRLRELGFDFTWTDGSSFVASSISGLLQEVSTGTGTISGIGQTASFGIVDSNSAFFGFLKALRENKMMKLLAEPDLVTVSGRPAFFNVGGEFPILVPQSLGTVSIEYKKFGTQLDFVPIVLGNGNIRLEVRPRVSEIDNALSVRIDDLTVPGLRVREVDTGAEMMAGQTMAIAGLLYTRQDSTFRGLPFIGEMPYVGALFRSVKEERNEIELLILVTPEVVAALDAEEVPPGGPGYNSCSPSDCQLYLEGHLEVPCCEGPQACGQCPRCKKSGLSMPDSGFYQQEGAYIEDVPPMERLPAASEVVPLPDTRFVPEPAGPPASASDRSASRRSSSYAAPSVQRHPSAAPNDGPQLDLRPISSRRVVRDPQNRHNPNARPSSAESTRTARRPGVIGPLGYDLQH